MALEKYSRSIPAHPPKSSGDLVFEQVLLFLPPAVRSILSRLPSSLQERTEEIRLRQGQPLALQWGGQSGFVTPRGMVTQKAVESYCLTGEDLFKTAQLISQNSRYAFEEEIKNGFLTLPGGHRVGLAGKVLLDGQGHIRTIKYITALNFRIARPVKGCALPVLAALLDEKKQFRHTLVISPPRCGKTTLIRDMVRLLSDGAPELGWPGSNIGLVDERSEVAGCYLGVPQKDVGMRTDVLDGCPKAEGMMLMVRSMAPRIIATDEIGRPEDTTALAEVLNAGIKVLATAHGRDIKDLARRPVFREILQMGIFERYVVLSARKGPGTVELLEKAGCRHCL